MSLVAAAAVRRRRFRAEVRTNCVSVRTAMRASGYSKPDDRPPIVTMHSPGAGMAFSTAVYEDGTPRSDSMAQSSRARRSSAASTTVRNFCFLYESASSATASPLPQ